MVAFSTWFWNFVDNFTTFPHQGQGCTFGAMPGELRSIFLLLLLWSLASLHKSLCKMKPGCCACCRDKNQKMCSSSSTVCIKFKLFPFQRWNICWNVDDSNTLEEERPYVVVAEMDVELIVTNGSQPLFLFPYAAFGWDVLHSTRACNKLHTLREEPKKKFMPCIQKNLLWKINLRDWLFLQWGAYPIKDLLTPSIPEKNWFELSQVFHIHPSKSS